jgi:tetratricopeptide (TPR) repeat protein/cellulose biosynthesis protein BcsQ
MKTISFYSYKGGVGRSLALVYTAKYLAERNIGVCILDTDLEAPGIAYKFPEKSKLILSKLGVVDYIHSCIEEDKIPDNIEEYISTIYEKNKYGYIKVMSVGEGMDKNKYWNKLSFINLDKLFIDKDGKEIDIFESLKEQIEEKIKPDYLLIDSRSGITTIGKICNSVLPDKVVMFSANNDENFLGAKLAYNHISNSADYKANKTKSDIICAITRYPTLEDVSDDYNKLLSKIDLNGESTIIKKFMDTVNNPNLKEDDISIIHSDRDVERNESSILHKNQGIEKKLINNDYEKLIYKFIDNNILKNENNIDKELLKKEEALTFKIPRYRFIEFNLHKTVERELDRIRGNMTLEKFYNNLKSDIEKEPKSCNLLHKRALYERYSNNKVKAVRILSDAIDNGKGDNVYDWTKSLYWRGIMFLYDFNNYDDAINDLEMAHKEIVHKFNQNFNRSIYYHLAVCCYCSEKYGSDKYNEAMKYIDCYLSNTDNEDNSFDSRIYLLRAVINGDKKPPAEKDKIISDYNMSISLNPDFAGSYNCMGLFYRNLGEIENAEENFLKAVETDPEYKFAYYNLGSLLVSEGKIEEAFDNYDKAIKLDSNYDYAYYRRGNLYHNLGKINEAFDDYNKAIEINPNFKAAYEARAEIMPTIKYYEKLEIDLQYDQFYYYDSEANIDKYTFPSVKYNRTDEYFEFAIRKNLNKRFLSDQGRTLKMLNEMFMLSEHVTKNLVAILKEFSVFRNGADFSIEIPENEDNKVLNEEVKYRLFRCISFMSRMHIFYEDYVDTHETSKYKFTKLDKPDTDDDSQYIVKKLSIPAKYYGIFIEYEFALLKKDNKIFLSDQGRTYKMLDKVFELEENDVKKNLNAIMKECRVLQSKEKFLVEIESEDAGIKLEENEATYRLLECVSFMDTMRIFYR